MTGFSENKDIVDQFGKWNLRLLRGFFSEASKEEEVFLRIDKDLLDQIGQDIGGDAGFLHAVRLGPSWVSQSASLVERIESLVKQRTNQFARRIVNYTDPGELDPTYQGCKAPTYLPYLAALVRCGTVYSQSYYEGLKNDLKLTQAFGSNEMRRIELAWGDLEKWTNDLEGRFGRFKLRILGGYSRIGVPRSQSILQHRDVEELINAFLQAEVRPGHELSEQEVTRILREAKASRRIYSAAFQSAMDKEAFEQPIRATISAAYADWDGTIPAKKKSQAVVGVREAYSKPELGLCLAVTEHEPLALAPLWWVPALQDTGNFRLTHPNGEWHGNFRGTEGATSQVNPENFPIIWNIIEQAYNGTEQFNIECLSGSDSEPTVTELLLQKHQLWILVPYFDGLSGDIELREGVLPGNGPAYLLAPPENTIRVREYLELEKPDHSIIHAEGLPNNWLLVCLNECATLEADQRLLPDGYESSHPTPRVIRFVGGRSVRRGYSRMYLPYDLPAIVLDAPEGAQIKYPDGLQLEEEISHPDNYVYIKTQFKTSKRFRVKLTNSYSASYTFQVVLNGNLLGQAKLRVAGLDGTLVETGQSFSLDNYGKPSPSSEGLSGILSDSAIDESTPSLVNNDFFNLPINSIALSSNYVEAPAGARERFLDALAQAGSVDYGVAREQILRLFQEVGEVVEPPLILLELRSRGHLEISTTHKGYMSRIHAVKPTVYELPIKISGKRAYGVTGTLRLSHWNLIIKDIPKETCAWVAYFVNRNKSFKPLRLLSDDKDYVQMACEEYEFRFAESPAVAIAYWSADIDSVREVIFRNPMESIGNALESAMRFNAGKGIFSAKPTNMSIELLKIRDLDIGMDNLYVLSDQGEFAFIRDSRWGVWLALDAFAELIEKISTISGVHPIPITYSSADGTLWLPARISLPCILERALVLCSGDSPDSIEIKHKSNNDRSDRINLFTHEELPPILTTNRFYNDMAIGKWLAYRWVPKSVASRIAKKLGAILDVI